MRVIGVAAACAGRGNLWCATIHVSTLTGLTASACSTLSPDCEVMLTRTSHSAVVPGDATATASRTPWALGSWPPVFWQANSRRRLRFVHLATRVTTGKCTRQPCCGQTIWVGSSTDCDARLAWDWIEIDRGIVAMVDPMAVLTNMHVVNLEGNILPAVEAALYINQFVRRLPWQEEVRRLLQLS